MKTKYKEAGVEFKCSRNRGHPERWSPRKITDCNAPERVAVPSDEIAERVGIHMTHDGAAGSFVYSSQKKLDRGV